MIRPDYLYCSSLPAPELAPASFGCRYNLLCERSNVGFGLKVFKGTRKSSNLMMIINQGNFAPFIAMQRNPILARSRD